MRKTPTHGLLAALALATIIASATSGLKGEPLIVEARAAQQPEADAPGFIRSANVSGIAPLASGELVAVALNAAESGPALVVYVGSPAERPLRLPAGEWWLYVLTFDGRVRQTASTQVLAARSSIVTVGSGLVDVPGDPAASTAAMATLVHFGLSSHLATLVPLGALAEAQATGDPTASDTIAGMADAMATRQQDVLAAADVLGQGAIGSVPAGTLASDFEIARVERLALNARAGIWEKIKGSFSSFFTSDAMTGASARKDIEALAQNYPPGRREELFQIARQRHAVDAENADEFFERLRAGAYDRLARQFHQDFIVGSEDYAIDAADARRRPLDTAARDGAQLVKDGAQFYADVVKTVLGARFGPGFDQGWELAQKIGDKVADLDKALNDPVGYARDLALGELGDRVDEIEGQIKDRLKEKILGTLRDAGLSESEAEQLAGEISERIADTSKEKLHEAAMAVRDEVLAARPPARPSDDVVDPPRRSDDIVVPTAVPVEPPSTAVPTAMIVVVPTATEVPVVPMATEVPVAPTATEVPVGPTASTAPTATATRIATPVPASTGGVEGLVRNASNGQAVVGATVSGGGRSATTDGSGRYQLTGLATGPVQVTASATGFISDTATVTVPASGNATQVFALSQSLAVGQTRIVLTWGATPRDLDSHLFVPGGAETYYSSRGTQTSSPFAALDVDDTNGSGPETITIARLSAGAYTYSVYNYSNEAAISASGARVQVYRGDGVVQSFTVPAGTGRWWNVFTMDGTTGAITAVNRISGAGR